MAEEKQENTKDTDINNTQPEKNPSTDTQTPKDDRNVYLMFIATGNKYIIKENIVAQGWSAHDMTFWFRKENIDKELNTYCENIKMGNDTNFKKVFKYLLSEIKPKDIIIAKYSSDFYICEIPKNYTFYYNKDLSNEYKQGLFPVNWIPCPEEIKKGIGEIKPNFYIKHYNDTNDKIKNLWDTNKKNYNNEVHNKETDEILSSEPKRKNESFKLYINGINIKIIEEKADLLQKNVKNLVLTGAPGTGKTHLARQIAEKIVKGNLTNLFNEKSESTNTNTINEIIDKWNIYKEKIIKKTLTIDEYSIAKDQDNLAYFIKYGSDIYSSQHTGKYSDWGIFKDEDSKYINLKGEIIQEKDAQDTFTKIKNILEKIFSKTSAKDMLQEIQDITNDDNPLINNWACLRKMVVLCFPKEFVPIVTDDKLMPPLNLLELSYSKDDFLNNNTQLVKYLKDNIKKDINENDIITWQRVLLDDNTKEKIESFIRTVQFHPSYDYTDFVEGLRPCYVKAKNDKPDQDSKQEIGFELKKGTFLDFCEKAEKDKANKYVFIIDEINRGEISKIFGEIFAAIEPGYRGNTKQKFQTQYANMHNDSNEFKESPFKDGFYVPDNLYIIGTMNDIDRSVESFDFALRRRFTWMEITAESQAIVMWTANELLSRGFDLDKLQNRMNNLNKKIEEIPGLSKDYHIGPAYFSKLKDYPKDEAYDKLWKNHLEPLLKEYLRGMENIDTNIRSLKEAYNNEN